MPYTTYNCDALTGGAARALDSHSVGDLVNGHRAFVDVSGEVLRFKYNSTGTAAENVSTHPYVVRPDDYSDAGNWEEQEVGGAGDVTAAANITDNRIVRGNGGAKGVQESLAAISDTGILSGIVEITGLTTSLTVAQGGSGTTGDSIIKTWIRFNGSGTIAIQDSFNVASITDVGVGIYTVTWDTDFANDDYSAISGSDHRHCTLDTCAIGSIAFRNYDDTHSLVDSACLCVIAIGDQA